MRSRQSPAIASLRRKWEQSNRSALHRSLRPISPWPGICGLIFGVSGISAAILLAVTSLDGSGPKPVPDAPSNKIVERAPGVTRPPDPSLPKRIPPPPQPSQEPHLAPVETPKLPDIKIELPKNLADNLGRIADQISKPPPAPQPDNVAPAHPAAEPSDEPVLIVDAPQSRPLGKIIIVRCSRSENVVSMLVHIEPPIPADDIYQSGDGKDFVFSVPDEGTWTVRMTAAGPTGKQTEIMRQIVVGQPTMPGVSNIKAATPSRQAINYASLAFARARAVRNADRKEQAKKIAGSFSAAAGMAGTSMVQTKQELVRATDKLIDRALPGEEYQEWKPFLLELVRDIAADPRASMSDLRQIWEQIADGLTRASR